LEPTWIIPVIVTLALLVGALGMKLFLSSRAKVFVKGMETGEQQFRMAMGFPDPKEEEAQREQAIVSKLSSKIRTPASLIFERYELLFDLDIAGYLASGILATRWIYMVGRIKELVEQKFDEFPPKTNTVVVRSIQVHKNGEGEFILEPMYNSELDEKEQPGGNHAG
jgi:hypothetical protein